MFDHTIMSVFYIMHVIRCRYTFDIVHNGAINTAAIFQCSTCIDSYLQSIDIKDCPLPLGTLVKFNFGYKNDRCLKIEKRCSMTPCAAYNM